LPPFPHPHGHPLPFLAHPSILSAYPMGVYYTGVLVGAHLWGGLADASV
jgi:hypothetical protein